ncbi:MAG: ceramide glucosyltransferase, partial [Alphaproteobacteria bacterium]
VHLVAAPFDQPLGQRTLAEVWSRQLRWARLRRVTFPLFFAPEIGCGPLLPFALALAAAPSPALAGLLLGLAALWYGAEIGLAARARWYRQPRLLLAFLIRDTLVPALWVSAWMRGAIVWRGNPMDIRTKASEPSGRSPWRRLRARASAA